MSDKVLVCRGGLTSGTFLKKFLEFNSLRLESTITITYNKIICFNATDDKILYAESHFFGDELKLEWKDDIPEDEREISLSYDTTDMKSILTGITSKDPLRLYITHYRDEFLTEWRGDMSTDNFKIGIGMGSGGRGLDGVRSISAFRVIPPKYAIYKPKLKLPILSIPIAEFKKMIGIFTKCKNKEIKICVYSDNEENDEDEEGFNFKSCLIMTDDIFNEDLTNTTVQKYGDVCCANFDPKESDDDKLDENEFLFTKDVLPKFKLFSNLDKDGNVKIYYEEGKHLKMSKKIAGFGETNIYLGNTYTNSNI